MSDDGVNCAVLHWLKLWDGVVFGNKMRDSGTKMRILSGRWVCSSLSCEYYYAPAVRKI